MFSRLSSLQVGRYDEVVPRITGAKRELQIRQISRGMLKTKWVYGR
jgi:hypothetical protein